jgi:hypothetical protein
MSHLNYDHRLLIQQGIAAGKSDAQIARELGVHRSTVGREIKRNSDCRENYEAFRADEANYQRQKAAVIKRDPYFGGVKLGSTLEKRDGIYMYISRTHFSVAAFFGRTSSTFCDKSYERWKEEERFKADRYFIRRGRFSWMIKNYSKSHESTTLSTNHPKSKSSAASKKINSSSGTSNKKAVSVKNFHIADPSAVSFYVFQSVLYRLTFDCIYNAKTNCIEFVIHREIAIAENGIINSGQCESALQMQISTVNSIIHHSII